ncbi:malto-oligosyltrehalose trehalohydrolase, partial [Pseudoxanthomonas sp. SGD-10]
MKPVIDINKRSIGVNFNDTHEAEILLWAPFAKEVSLILDRNNSKLLLNQSDYGYWTLKTNELKAGDLYRFNIGHGRDLPDPASLSQPQGVHGASEAINLKEFNWTDSHWNNLSLKDYIIYELHVGTFTPGGTFKEIEDKLDYLVELGISAIEIMPIAQFPGDRNWGYDGVFPFAVQNTYGGAKALQQLVDAC